MKRLLSPILLMLLLIGTISAQERTPQTDADSLVQADDDLFGGLDSLDIEAPSKSESEPSRGPLPAGMSRKFGLNPGQRDLLELHDNYAWLSYDRADGLYLGVGTDLPARNFIERRVQGYFGFGYSLGSHYWQVFGGLSRDFLAQETPLRIGAEGHVITDTRDAWKMGNAENTAYALLDGIDTRDYFQRRGFSISAQQFISPRVALKAEYRWDKYRNSKREIKWSLFGPEQPFLEVPPVQEGRMTSVVLSALADFMTRRTWNDPQFGAEAQLEFGSMEENFTELVADARLKVTAADDLLWVAVRARLGSVTGDAPSQKLFTIGGLGTLPGYPQNRYVGNRMLLVQTDLLLKPFGDLRIIFENNFGAVSNTATTSELFGGFPEKLGDFMYSPGIYLGSATGSFRIGASWRTDIFESPEFVIRFSQPF